MAQEAKSSAWTSAMALRVQETPSTAAGSAHCQRGSGADGEAVAGEEVQRAEVHNADHDCAEVSGIDVLVSWP